MCKSKFQTIQKLPISRRKKLFALILCRVQGCLWSREPNKIMPVGIRIYLHLHKIVTLQFPFSQLYPRFRSSFHMFLFFHISPLLKLSQELQALDTYISNLLSIHIVIPAILMAFKSPKLCVIIILVQLRPIVLFTVEFSSKYSMGLTT